MLQEIKDLQERAVSQLTAKLKTKRELTFRAPTGSGKTRMMGDLMNRVLSANSQVEPENSQVVFLVSSLSKGDLARQNYESFAACVRDGVYPALRPYLISSEISGEETLFIPTDYNVYVLPRDLFKKQGKLMAGPMVNFLNQMTKGRLFGGQGKQIYLIKDECHQATNNLDELSPTFFTKILNFSATPNLRRGQSPDVQITDDEAEQVKLIKHVEQGADTDTIEDAVCKFMEIQQQYTSLAVNPCMIIQISNKDKAEQEWQQQIRPVLDRHQSLKWMLIVNEKNKCDTNDDLKKLSVDQWKDYAKRPTSSIDIIIFKMTISEGWDIPRACMLYQVRDTQSKQLDEQVMGRVRRNPRLTDFETLTAEQQKLATTAWVWGILPDTARKTYQVSLWNDTATVQQLPIKTIYLKSLTQRKDFSIEKFLEQQPTGVTSAGSIFALYRRLQTTENDLQDLCYSYTAQDVRKWFLFMEHIDKIRKQHDQFIYDYDKSMEVAAQLTSFPAQSYYTDNGNRYKIKDWIWRKKDGSWFSFDSEAESGWAEILDEAAEQYIAKLEEQNLLNENTCYLWGKNFLPGSEIRYEYYAAGIHSSYPDFIMKDRHGRIHLFEVKSLNQSSALSIDNEEYSQKVRVLKDCYLACSKKLPDYYFYLPIRKGGCWQITRFHDGQEDDIDQSQFLDSLE